MPCRRRRLGALLIAAGLLAGMPLAQAQVPDQEPALALVAATLDLALDQGDGQQVLAVLGAAAVAAPGRAVDLAAMGTRLAPWMAADVAAAVLAAVPAEARAAMASQVLAAVLTAGQGRLGAQVLAAIHQAVPQADAVPLQDLARRLSVGGGTAADRDLALADLTAEGAPASVRGAVLRARQADLEGRQVIGRLPPRGRRALAAPSGLATPDLTEPAAAETIQPRATELPRLLEPPRLPDPQWIASPS